MKVSELTGAELDYWVAQAEGKKYCFISGKFDACWDSEATDDNDSLDGIYAPSSNWAQGGPIIERERIELRPESNGQWFAVAMDGSESYGTTPLIAAMRAYVASKYGEEVPDEISSHNSRNF